MIPQYVLLLLISEFLNLFPCSSKSLGLFVNSVSRVT